MNKGRMEAFSDGVIAVIITIMVLELKVPHGARFEDLVSLAPVFTGYVLSFVFVGIYWNNHHHLLHIAKHVSGGVMWANLHLLFWLSLVPFFTGWWGETEGSPLPTALYGVVLLMAGMAYSILQVLILRQHPPDSPVVLPFRNNFKGRFSLIFYAIAIPCSFYQRWVSNALYVVVAAMWLIPDRRIEGQVKHHASEASSSQ